jgi:hypothetical protein
MTAFGSSDPRLLLCDGLRGACEHTCGRVSTLVTDVTGAQASHCDGARPLPDGAVRRVAYPVVSKTRWQQ